MHVSRRTFLGSAVISAAGLPPSRTFAQDTKQPSPDKALADLTEGNRLYAAGKSTPPGELAPGQKPKATIVCCSDSRAPPELIFNCSYGELFVVRNAGNTASTTQSLGTVEYSVWKLGVPLILVLGHSQCGAVEAATAVVDSNATFPGVIGPLVEPILPPALAVRRLPGNPVDNGIRENVLRVRNALRSPEQPILYPAIREGKLRIAGAIYDLATRTVTWLPD